MEILNWIDKSLSNIRESELYNRYFKCTNIENVDDSMYLFNPDLGIDLVMSSSYIVNTIHLFSGKSNVSKQFVDKNPFGINFDMTRKDILKFFGSPQRSNNRHSDITGHVPSWDKYYFISYTLHLQYMSNSSIDLITVGSLTLEPYLNIGLQ